MKETSNSDASTSMSVQEMWLDAISSGRFSVIAPCWWMRKPSALTSILCQRPRDEVLAVPAGLHRQDLERHQQQRRKRRRSKARPPAGSCRSFRAQNPQAEYGYALTKIAPHDKRAARACGGLVVARALADLGEAEPAVERDRRGVGLVDFEEQRFGALGMQVRAAPRPSAASRALAAGAPWRPRRSGFRPRRRPAGPA